MAIPFDNIPSNILVPLFWAETRPAQAPYSGSLRHLLIGIKNHGAPATNNLPYILSDQKARELFGAGSPLHWMYVRARENAPFAEIWGMAAAPAVDAVAGVGFVRVAAAPSAANSGTLSFMIGAKPVSVTVRSTDTRQQVATRIAAVINSNTTHYVTAAIDGSDDTQVNLTVKFRGSLAGYISVTVDRFGENVLAAKLFGGAVSNPTGGTGEFSISAGFAALGDQRFDVITIYRGGPELAAADAFMDHESGRWSPYQQLYGHVVTAINGDFATLVAAGAARNGPHVSLFGATNSPSPIWEWAAAAGSQAALHLEGPPEISRPLQTLPLKGIMASQNMADWHDITERQSLINAGVSTHTVDPDGTVRINRFVTMRKTNVWGDNDASWRDVNTLFQTMYFVRSMRAAITGTFPRAALTDQDSGIPGFASPGQIRDVLVHEYKRLEALGLVENSDLFAEALVVERNAIDANRVDVLMRPDMVNQLVIFAALIETHLQLTPEGVELLT